MLEYWEGVKYHIIHECQVWFDSDVIFCLKAKIITEWELFIQIEDKIKEMSLLVDDDT